mgnify:CR=1 FL=1
MFRKIKILISSTLVFAFSFAIYRQNRPLLATNLFGIILPISSIVVHLKQFLIPSSLEIQSVPYLSQSLTPSLPFDVSNLPPAPDYSDDDTWAALWPRIDTADLISDGWYSEDKNSSNDDPISSQDQARCDMFYLHPTTYFSGEGWNAPHNDKGAALMVDEGIVFQQASAFHLGCRIFAPRFRQMTAVGYLNRTNGNKALNVAYSDVKRAFESFLFRRQTECRRSIVLASHSQGTTLMERLLLDFFAQDDTRGADLRSKLVAAYLIGMEIHDGPYSYSKKPAKDAARDVENARRVNKVLIPLCEHPEQIGCVVAYRSFLQEPDVCKSFLGRPSIPAFASRKNQRVVCTNPLSWTVMSEGEGLRGKAKHLGCMPIVHPWANAYYLLFGQGGAQSSYDRLKNYISDIDAECTVDARCNEDGMLLVNMPWWTQKWAHGYLVPFPQWTVFSFPGLNTHAYDYNLFFNNLRKNSVERVRRWENANPKPKIEIENDGT